MDRNTIRYLCFLAFLIFHNGQLTKGLSEGCSFDPRICNSDEYCEEGVCLKWESRRDYYGYNDERRQDRGDGYRRDEDLAYQERRDEISQHGYANEERDYDSSEPTLEDRTLIKSLPLPDSSNDHRSDVESRRSSRVKNERLPPIVPVYWDKIGEENDIEDRGLVDNQGRVGNANQHVEEQDRRQTAPEDTFLGKGPDDILPPVSLNEESKTLPVVEDADTARRNDMPLFPEKSDAETRKLSWPLEHNTREASTSDSSNGKVMIKGEVKVTGDAIDQGPNPEKNYDDMKDFFKSQQASSIVVVPNTVKKEEAAKIYDTSFVPIQKTKLDEVAKEEDLSGSKRDTLKISLDKNVAGQAVKARMAKNDYSPETEQDVAKRMNEDAGVKDQVARQMNVHILSAEGERPIKYETKPKKKVENKQPKYFLVTVIIVGCVTGVILAAVAIYLIMKRYNETKKFKPVSLPGQEAATDYQELCRQLRANQGWDSAPTKIAPHAEKEKGLLGSTKAPKYTWSEEPVVPNMDISTGHVVLAYMEDHLKNKNRLNKEWEALCTYEAEPNSAEIGKQDKNVRKNRYSDVLPYDHNRVSLRETTNATGSDYANASFITDHDPRNPAYIATQGPLAHTVSDFWQMVWEQGVVVIVNLTRLSDLGLPQCHRYWPEDGHETYHIYEVHLVSEHIWCDDYLVRSFYLKNLQTSETRTVTQFHFLSWPDLNVPTSPKPLLEFRRKVNKCFRGRSCPIVVHCSGGVGRTGCYILIDMVLNKMMRGAKEIDIAATVEHLRDQRPHMVKTKAQFEFALTAVAEEVNAILQALAK